MSQVILRHMTLNKCLSPAAESLQLVLIAPLRFRLLKSYDFLHRFSSFFFALKFSHEKLPSSATHVILFLYSLYTRCGIIVTDDFASKCKPYL